MATTLQITESPPASRPAVTLSMSLAVTALLETAWVRVEAWIAHRWGARAAVFVAEGPGDWRPPLSPATIDTVEIWRAGAWEAVTLNTEPLGGVYFDQTGPFRITATVGTSDAPPADVQEALRRLALFFASVVEIDRGYLGVTRFRIDDFEMERAQPNWPARTLQLSGAADLLRPYRRLGEV